MYHFYYISTADVRDFELAQLKPVEALPKVASQ